MQFLDFQKNEMTAKAYKQQMKVLIKQDEERDEVIDAKLFGNISNQILSFGSAVLL